MDKSETQRVRVNKNAWKSKLIKEIVILEDNLDQIFHTAGLKPHRVVQENDNEVSRFVVDEKGVNNQTKDFQAIIDEQYRGVHNSACRICSLVNSVTEFDLPIPVHVLLRLAARIGSVKWTDYKKKLSGSLAKRYVYSLTPKLIETSLMMFRWISVVLGTNIIPFQPFINQNILNILEWTRTSDLMDHDPANYFKQRSQALKNISVSIEQLSLNLNLDPKQLKTLVQLELVDNFELTMSRASTCPARLIDEYAMNALSCLEKLFIVYANFLEAPLEGKLKNFVVQTCIKIYRDFEKNVIGLAGRRQLHQLLQTIANRPFATSTSELAYHIFELIEKVETDPELRYLARKSLKIGMAHRPTIVSHFDVYNLYARPMSNVIEQSSNTTTEKENLKEDGVRIEEEMRIEEEVRIEEGTRIEEGVGIEEEEARIEKGQMIQDEVRIEEEHRIEEEVSIEQEGRLQQEDRDKKKEEEEEEKKRDEDHVESDQEVQLYMSYFVEKLKDPPA